MKDEPKLTVPKLPEVPLAEQRAMGNVFGG